MNSDSLAQRCAGRGSGWLRPGKAGLKGKRTRKTLEIRKILSSGCEPRPTKAQSRRSVASLATAWITTTAMRRHTRIWAMGKQPRKPQHTGAQGFIPLEGSSARDARDEERARPAGCMTMARVQEDGPVIWEALPPLHENRRGNGDRSNNPNEAASAWARAPRRRRSPRHEGRPERGEPKRGRERAQGVGVPYRSEDIGERSAPGPGRAKRARAGVNLWRET
jgi:hypothetical protein